MAFHGACSGLYCDDPAGAFAAPRLQGEPSLHTSGRSDRQVPWVTSYAAFVSFRLARLERLNGCSKLFRQSANRQGGGAGSHAGCRFHLECRQR